MVPTELQVNIFVPFEKIDQNTSKRIISKNENIFLFHIYKKIRPNKHLTKHNAINPKSLTGPQRRKISDHPQIAWRKCLSRLYSDRDNTNQSPRCEAFPLQHRDPHYKINTLLRPCFPFNYFLNRIMRRSAPVQIPMSEAL